MKCSFAARCEHGAFTDTASFDAHAKAHKRATFLGKPITGSVFRKPRMWRMPTTRPFDPALGEVGSWVTFTDWADREVTGQVWAEIIGGLRARVWVADGNRYHDMAVSSLSAAVEVEQPTLAA